MSLEHYLTIITPCVGCLTIITQIITMDPDDYSQWISVILIITSVSFATLRRIKPSQDKEDIRWLVRFVDDMYLPIWGFNALLPFIHTKDDVFMAIQLYTFVCIINTFHIIVKKKPSPIILLPYYAVCLSWISIISAFSGGWFTVTFIFLYVAIQLDNIEPFDYHLCIYVSYILLKIF